MCTTGIHGVGVPCCTWCCGTLLYMVLWYLIVNGVVVPSYTWFCGTLLYMVLWYLVVHGVGVGEVPAVLSQHLGEDDVSLVPAG